MLKYLLPVLLLASPTLSQAAGCGDLKTCGKLMNELLGQQYVWSDDADKIKFHSSGEIQLTKENAELLFTAILDQAGLARMPVGDGKTYRVVKNTSMRENELPLLKASLAENPRFPQTWDWVTLQYKASHPESVSHIEQSYRLHVPRESRFMADTNAGTILVSAPAPVARKMLETLREADKPISALTKKELQERQKRAENKRFAPNP